MLRALVLYYYKQITLKTFYGRYTINEKQKKRNLKYKNITTYPLF